MGQMMKAAQKMQKEMLKAQEGLKDKFVEGTAGGGIVKVLVNGQKELVKITIDRDFAVEELEDADDVAALEDLIMNAVQDGMDKAQKLMEESMGGITGGLGMNLPGLF